MSREGVRLVVALPFGKDASLRRLAARYAESEWRIVPPAAARRLAAELLERWADQERRREIRFREHMRRLEELREAGANDLARRLDSFPLRALLDVAAELRDVERELRAATWTVDLGQVAAAIAGELAELAGELEAARVAPGG